MKNDYNFKNLIIDYNNFGFIYFKHVLNKRELNLYLNEVRILYDHEQLEISSGLRDKHKDHIMYSEYGDHFYNIARKTRVFDPLYVNQFLLNFLKLVFLDRFILSQTEVRRNKFSQKDVGVNKFHRDARFFTDKNLWAIAFWPLEDVTFNNGPTEVIPGSHCSYEFNGDKKQLLLAEAGDLIIMNANLLHRSIKMTSDISRWMIINTYNHWSLKPAIDHTNIFKYKELINVDNDLIDIFGYTSVPPFNERERIYTCVSPEELKKDCGNENY